MLLIFAGFANYSIGQNRNKLKIIQALGSYVLYADGYTDDTDALNAWGRGEVVRYKGGKKVGRILENGTFLISGKIKFNKNNSTVRNNTFILERDRGYFNRNILDFNWKVRNYNNKIVIQDRYNRNKRY